MTQAVDYVSIILNSPLNSPLEQAAKPPSLQGLQESRLPSKPSKSALRRVKAESATQSNLRGLTALAPQYQMQREREAIQNDPHFLSIFGTPEGVEIKKQGEKEYLVQGKGKALIVQIEYLAMKRMGPKQFQLHFPAGT